MNFNPTRMREVTEEGGLARVLRTKYEENAPMGNIAKCDLAEVIEAWLIGLHAEVAPVIPRSLEWLNLAIEGKEEDRFGQSPGFHRCTLYWAKGMGQWMLTGQDDKRSFAAALDGWTNYLQHGGVKVLGPDIFNYEIQKFQRNEIRNIPKPTKEVLSDGSLDDYMALSFQAAQYEAGIATFEMYVGAKAVSLKRALKPRELGYALCLHHARQKFDASDLFEAGRKMLQTKLEDDWLGRGQYLRAATWLKIVYWHHDPSLTPLQTILKAYDDMPNVARPAFA